MTAEREAAIRARLGFILDEAEYRARNESGKCTGVDCPGCNEGRRVAGARSDLEHLLALVDRQATALDAVREMAEVQEASCRAQHRADHAQNWRTVLAALAAADDDGTGRHGRAENAADRHTGAREGIQGVQPDDHARDNGTTTEGDMR